MLYGSLMFSGIGAFPARTSASCAIFAAAAVPPARCPSCAADCCGIPGGACATACALRSFAPYCTISVTADTSRFSTVAIRSVMMSKIPAGTCNAGATLIAWNRPTSCVADSSVSAPNWNTG
jgi:hypothetical protein